MTILVDLSSDTQAPDDLQTTASLMARALRNAGAVTAKPAAFRPESGTRGGALAIGALVLDILDNSAVAAVIEVIGAYLTRDKTMKVKMTLADGTVLEVDSKNLHRRDIESAMQAMVRAHSQEA